MLMVSGYPSLTTAGVANNLAVTAYDPFNNVATGYTGTVHFTSSDTQAVVPPNYTFTAGDAGVHTFSAALKTAGTESIIATDMVTNTITGTQSPITVNPAAASTLTLGGYPSPTTAGVAHTFTVTANYLYSNMATGYAATVHFTSSDGQGGPPTQLHIHSWRCGSAHLHGDAEDGGTAVDHRHRHSHFVGHWDAESDPGQPGSDQHPGGERLHEPDHGG